MICARVSTLRPSRRQQARVCGASSRLAAAHALVKADVDNAVYRLSGAELLSYQQLCELVSVAGADWAWRP